LLKKETALKGLAVTIPYKESVMPFLDIIDKEATLIGAVNCIGISSGKLTGYNTDHIGFEMSLKPLLKSHHLKALVLGSGGSSKAVQYVLQKLEIEYLVVTRVGAVSHPDCQRSGERHHCQKPGGSTAVALNNRNNNDYEYGYQNRQNTLKLHGSLHIFFNFSGVYPLCLKRSRG
jgi:shikimate 5-dehydrogenase